MTRIRFHLAISYDQYRLVYEGSRKTIRVRADDGRTIDFPAGNVQKFLTREGIHGYFEMPLSAENRFVGINRIDA